MKRENRSESSIEGLIAAHTDTAHEGYHEALGFEDEELPWFFNDNMDIYPCESLSLTCIGAKPCSWSKDELYEALIDLVYPSQRVAVSWKLLTKKQALDYQGLWEKSGHLILRALFRYSVDSPEPKRHTPWRGSDLLEQLSRIDDITCPYPIFLVASRHFSVEQVNAVDWRAPNAWPIYYTLKNKSTPMAPTPECPWRSIDLLKVLIEFKDADIDHFRAIGSRLIPIEGSEKHSWKKLGSHTYMHLEAAAKVLSKEELYALWEEIKGVGTIDQLEAIAIYGLKREDTELFDWDKDGEEIIDTLEKSYERRESAEDTLVSLKSKYMTVAHHLSQKKHSLGPQSSSGSDDSTDTKRPFSSQTSSETDSIIHAEVALKTTGNASESCQEWNQEGSEPDPKRIKMSTTA